jgi:hypothetical protein
MIRRPPTFVCGTPHSSVTPISDCIGDGIVLGRLIESQQLTPGTSKPAAPCRLDQHEVARRDFLQIGLLGPLTLSRRRNGQARAGSARPESGFSRANTASRCVAS